MTAAHSQPNKLAFVLSFVESEHCKCRIRFSQTVCQEQQAASGKKWLMFFDVFGGLFCITRLLVGNSASATHAEPNSMSLLLQISIVIHGEVRHSPAGRSISGYAKNEDIIRSANHLKPFSIFELRTISTSQERRSGTKQKILNHPPSF